MIASDGVSAVFNNLVLRSSISVNIFDNLVSTCYANFSADVSDAGVFKSIYVFTELIGETPDISAIILVITPVMVVIWEVIVASAGIILIWVSILTNDVLVIVILSVTSFRDYIDRKDNKEDYENEEEILTIANNISTTTLGGTYIFNIILLIIVVNILK